MVEYSRRIVDDLLDEFFPDFAAISIEGARAIGKTSTARQHVATTVNVDLPEVGEIFRADPGQVSRLEPPVLIDEWQHVPEIWDRVRRFVDTDPSGGRFILAGSAAPSGAPVHSGAGRIISFRMRPLSVAERELAVPSVRLRDLLAGRVPDVQGSCDVALSDYAREIVSSGFPLPRRLSARARGIWLDDYLERIITHDFAKQGHRVRRPELLRGWLRGYAAATASSTTYSKIAAAVDPGEKRVPAKSTSLAFRDVLGSLYLLDQVDAWEPGRDLVARASRAPKHFLVDPALSARLLDLNEAKLLSATAPAVNGSDRTRLGDFFEALVALSLKTYAQANGARVSHFRDHDGRHEVDFIVHRGHAEAVGIEVKLKAAITDHDVRHLLWLRGAARDRVVDLVVITTGAHAYRRPDGVAVIPLALLAP